MYYVYDKWNLFGFRCINEKKCATPECDYGRYVTSAGRCPRRNELRPRSWESQLGSIFPSICVSAKCQQNNFLYRLFILFRRRVIVREMTSPSSWWWCALRHISRSSISKPTRFHFDTIFTTHRRSLAWLEYRISRYYYSATVSYVISTQRRRPANYLEKQQRKK